MENKLKLIIHRLFHWEYWSMSFIYYPIFPIWLYYAIKAKSFFFFNAANPSIKNGGMAMESKKEIYDLIPPQYIPKTVLIKKESKVEEIISIVNKAGIQFPLIVKPDVGLKSFAVERLKTQRELELYSNKISNHFLIQELIEFPNEIGVFYVRLPNEKEGKITGIVSKEFLSVTGNSVDSLLQLINKNPRSSFQLSFLKRKYGDLLATILPENEKYILVPFGSHTRGAKFIDVSHRINKKLLNKINDICIQIPGFYFGRLDILCSSFEELENGENFSIIEINGAGSEPTHIYDPKHSLFFAWKEIIKHWKLMYQISDLNNKKGHHYLSFKEGREMLRANSLLEAKLKMI